MCNRAVRVASARVDEKGVPGGAWGRFGGTGEKDMGSSAHGHRRRRARRRAARRALAVLLACAALVALAAASPRGADGRPLGLAGVAPEGAPQVAVWVLAALFAAAVVRTLARGWHDWRLSRRIDRLASGSASMTPEEFLERHCELIRAGDFAGIYVLHNATRDLYYVGQGRRVLSRLLQHFSGRGNGDVYADWRYGDEFRIRTLRLEGSGYRSLDDLERDAIERYDAYGSGYNRNRGIGA